MTENLIDSVARARRVANPQTETELTAELADKVAIAPLEDRLAQDFRRDRVTSDHFGLLPEIAISLAI